MALQAASSRHGGARRQPPALSSGGGVYAQAGFDLTLLRYLRPGEVLEVGPVRWMTPAGALAYPEVGAERQYEFFAAVSQRGFNLWMHRWEDGRRVVKEHGLWRFADMGALKAGSAVRKRGGLRSRDELVVLLQLWDRSGGLFTCESRYQLAEAQVQALGRVLRAIPDRGIAPERYRDAVDVLDRLAQLHADGALTTEEWETAKAAIIGVPPDAKLAAMEEVRRLYQLFGAGAISDYEYKRKKLELLTW